MFSENNIRKLFSFLSLFVLLLIVARLFHLQVIEGDRYKSFVNSQIDSSVTVSKNRGNIYDIDGNLIAKNKIVASLYAYGKNIPDMSVFDSVLKANGITLSRKTINSLRNKNKFTWVERRIDIEKAEKLVAQLKGLEYFKEEARFYVEGNTMASLVGFTGADNAGRAGLEYVLNDELGGDEATIASLRDSRGRLILFEDKAAALKPESEVYLTVSNRIQSTAEYLLRAGAKEFGAKNGTAIAIDVKTGEIIFAADVDSFDPENYSKYAQKTWKSIALSQSYEPGSTFKTVAFSYLYDNNKLNLNQKIDTNKKVTVGKYTYTDTKDYGVLGVEDVFVKSSNIGIAHLMKNDNRDNFYAFLSQAGFGKKTGIYGVPEESGRLKNVKEWSKTSPISMAIGYEVLVTPLQIARFYAAIANGGEMVTPKVINKLVTNGSEQHIENSSVSVMKPETADYMMKLMRKTVEEGTGSGAKTSLINIAGKTGTASIYDAKVGAYSKEHYYASFAGVFPSEEPKVAMIVLYESPRSSIYGGATAANVFRQIAEYIATERKYFKPTLKVAYGR